MLLRLSLYWLNYLVVRWQLVLTVVVAWLAAWWLKSHYGEEDSNLWLVMFIFLRLVQWTIVGLFGLSLLMATLAWGFFMLARRNKKFTAQIQLGEDQRAEAGRVQLKITLLGPAIRPLLGTIRARLIFAGKKMSEPIILDSDLRKKGNIFRKGVEGTGTTLLHDRGIYDVEKVHFTFCDMFNLVAIPANIPFVKQLYTLPRELEAKEVKAQPNTTEEQKHRIEIPKRVEGEYINYKEFETGDNIRRIVWQIYAKSGELVVRIPETKDPYASHLYFYISFYEDLPLQDGIFDTELLNVYKDKVRNLFEALLKNGYDVRLPQDQEVPKLSGMGDKHNELFQITAAHWQRANSPATYVDTAKAAFVCLSALTPAAEIETLLRKLPEPVPVIIVKLSDAIPSPFKWDFKDFFFRPEKQAYDKLRNPWFVSPMRRKILKNEEEIRTVIKKKKNAWLASAIEIEE